MATFSNCYICGGAHRMVADHDDASDRIRGYLCSNCNVAIGLLYHNPRLILAAAAYCTASPIGPSYTEDAADRKREWQRNWRREQYAEHAPYRERAKIRAREWHANNKEYANAGRRRRYLAAKERADAV